MFCHRCGAKVSEDSLFCRHCGAKQEVETPDERPEVREEPRYVEVPRHSEPPRYVERPRYVEAPRYEEPIVEEDTISREKVVNKLLALCRHPLMILVSVIASIFALIDVANTLRGLSVLDGASGNVIFTWFVGGLEATAFVLLAVGGWIAVAGGYGNPSGACRGLKLMNLGMCFASATAWCYAILYIYSGESYTEIPGISTTLLVTGILFAVFAVLYILVARFFRAFACNLSIGMDPEINDGVLIETGKGTGIAIFVIIGLLGMLLMVAGDAIGEMGALLGSGSTMVLLMLVLGALHVFVGVISLLHEFCVFELKYRE